MTTQYMLQSQGAVLSVTQLGISSKSWPRAPPRILTALALQNQLLCGSSGGLSRLFCVTFFQTSDNSSFPTFPMLSMVFLDLVKVGNCYC